MNKNRTIHELKTDPEQFEAFFSGRKRFEIRYNDRDYRVGDRLALRETKYSHAEMSQGQPLEYTGREDVLFVRYILRGPAYGLQEGWVIMS